RVSAEDDAGDVRNLVSEAARPDMVHAHARPPHAASARAPHDDDVALHDASLHPLQRPAANPTAALKLAGSAPVRARPLKSRSGSAASARRTEANSRPRH